MQTYALSHSVDYFVLAIYHYYENTDWRSSPSDIIYYAWSLGRQQSLSTSACLEPARPIRPKRTAWFSSLSKLFFSTLFAAFLSSSFRLAACCPCDCLWFSTTTTTTMTTTKACPSHLHRRLMVILITPLSSCLHLLSRSSLEIFSGQDILKKCKKTQCVCVLKEWLNPYTKDTPYPVGPIPSSGIISA